MFEVWQEFVGIIVCRLRQMMRQHLLHANEIDSEVEEIRLVKWWFP